MVPSEKCITSITGGSLLELDGFHALNLTADSLCPRKALLVKLGGGANPNGSDVVKEFISALRPTGGSCWGLLWDSHGGWKGLTSWDGNHSGV